MKKTAILLLIAAALMACTPDETVGHSFSMSCKVTACNGDLSTPDGRTNLVKWCRRNHISRLWLESYRHGERVSSDLLAEERDAFLAAGLDVCGMITPTCLGTPDADGTAPIEVCWSDTAALLRLADEVTRTAALFDRIIIDDFLFTDHWETCSSCAADKQRRDIDDWEEYRRALLFDVCRDYIIAPAQAKNPRVQMIIKFPCWWRDWEKRGYSPAAQAELFGECWVGTETRNANSDPLQACNIVIYTDSLTSHRCGGGWYDALDCTPEKFVEQAYYTILGGAHESLIHCYDYLLADDPGRTPYGEQADNKHACTTLFEQHSDRLFTLAQQLAGSEVVSVHKDNDDVSTHVFRKDGHTIVVRFNRRDLTFHIERHRSARTKARHASTLDYIDPMIGTEGEGSEYGGLMPYVGVPFASAQWTAMTRLCDVSCLSYNSADSMLLGFIGTRQPAIWMGDWGQVSLQPQRTAEPVLDYDQRGQHITSQQFTPYGGSVVADGIETHFSALEHSAVLTFSSARSLVIDASRASGGPYSDPAPHTGHIAFATDGRSVSGWNSDLFDGAHADPLPGFRGYFYMEFSRPFISSHCEGNDGDEVHGSVTFDSDGPLTVHIGLSLISAEQARANLLNEVGRHSVEKVAKCARKKWQQQFNVLSIEAADSVKTIFYTALYHSLLYPRRIDEQGQYYSAFDDTIHTGVMYNCWSMWDTYRALHPLLTLVAPDRIDDMMQSLVEMYHEGGWLPKWPNPSYTGIMVGSPAETILAEAWTKGFRCFDIHEAYAAVKKNATVPQQGDTLQRWQDRGCFGSTPETRAGLTRYMTLGYVAADETNESVSRTLDFCLQDRAAAILAEAAGYPDDATYFLQRSDNWRNLWDADKRLFVPRAVDGHPMNPYDGWHYTECTPQTALWCVPFDVEGLAEILGGRDNMAVLLDEYFDTRFFVPERGNRSIHGNESGHHVAYMYNRIGHPEKTEQRVRQILSRCYATTRKGFDGNEDCGQMSAWYILSSLGLYMLNPADGWYELGAPCVDSAMLRLPDRRTLHIKVKGLSADHTTVRRVTWNGQPLPERRIPHSTLVQGGALLFEYE